MYDSRGRLQQVTGPRNDLVQKWILGYYPDTDADFARRGQLQSLTDPLNHVINVAADVSPYNTYSDFGDPLSVTDPNSVIADLTFDGLGRLTKRTIKGVNGDPAPLTTTYSYTSAGLLSQVTSPVGNRVTFGYDSSNRLLTADRADTGALEHERFQIDYDPMSQPLDELSRACGTPAANCTTWSTSQQDNFVFDTYGRLSEIDHPLSAGGGKMVFGYDAAGNLTTVQDENHSSANATYGYDLANRLVSLTQTLASASGGQILSSFGYDVLDDLNAVTDPNGNQTTYVFDDFGREKTEISPVSGTSSYAYDADNNLTSFTDANTVVTSTMYDALDRVLLAKSRLGASTEQVAFSYDDATSGHFGIGRLASMTDPTGSTKYTYERRGLLQTEARTILGTVFNLAYGYDHNDNRNLLTYPDNSTVTYTFDWANRPISAVKGSTTYVSSASYEPFGPISQLISGSGAAQTTQTFTYDLRYRPSENKLVNGSGTLADYLYQEDLVGNVTQINDNTPNNAGYNRAFGYDDLNRLTTANSGTSLWGTASGNGYSYDSMDNLKSIQLGSGRTTSFAYSGTLPKLTTVTDNGTPRSVSYDAVGNEKTVGSGSYTYTLRNMLATGDDGLSYTYDGWGRRLISTTASGSRYSFYGPDMTLLSETNVATGSPTVAYDYIYFDARPVA